MRFPSGLFLSALHHLRHEAAHTTVLPDQWRIAMDVTCLGIYRAVRAAYPYMKERGYGRIMNFASIGGRANRGVPVTYAGFKAAAIGITRALALELAADGITVNSMAPASLDTSAFERIPEKDSIPMKPLRGRSRAGPERRREDRSFPAARLPHWMKSRMSSCLCAVMIPHF